MKFQLFSPTVKLILLQNAERGISDLRTVETLDDFSLLLKDMENLPTSSMRLTMTC